MTKAAFQACYADFRLVKGRKCAQFVFEVALEGADAALAALGGLPRPDQEAWVAVARIDPKASVTISDDRELKAEHALHQERRAWNDLPAVQQAGIRCGEKRFWEFLEFGWSGLKIMCAEDAAQFVRDRCVVNSRSKLLPGTPAEQRWKFVEAKYQDWLANERYAEDAR